MKAMPRRRRSGHAPAWTVGPIFDDDAQALELATNPVRGCPLLLGAHLLAQVDQELNERRRRQLHALRFEPEAERPRQLPQRRLYRGDVYARAAAVAQAIDLA